MKNFIWKCQNDKNVRKLNVAKKKEFVINQNCLINKWYGVEIL